MSDLQLIDAVAHVTGEDALEIRRRGFVLTGPEDSRSNPEPECLLDVMLVDLRKRARSTGTRSALGAVSRSSRARSRPGRRVGPRPAKMAKNSRDSQVIPARLARMARLCPQPAVAMDGTAGVKTERAKGLEPSTSSLGS